MSPLPSNLSLQALNHFDIGVGTLVVSFVVYSIFHRYEPESPTAILSFFLLIPSGLGILARQCTGSNLASVVTATAYYSLLTLFTVLYRISPFHPLSKFPGPALHKISKLRSAQVAQRGDLHRHYQKLHQRYGDVVRVGPNELSYLNVDGVRGTLNNGMPKGPFYERKKDVVAMLNSRDPITHAHLRKPWNRAFTTTSLKGYEEMVIRRARELIGSLDKRHSEKLDISEWMEFFSFDFMGELVFSFSFDMMKDGNDLNGYWKTLTGSLKRLGVSAQIPWAFRYITSPSNPFRSSQDTEDLAKIMVSHRLKAGSMTKDLFYHLSYEDEKKTEEISMKQLVAEGLVAIVAGSDTTSTVLANLWYYLLRNPAYFARLRAEVDVAFPTGEDPVDQEILSEMRYLNACINECLRLQPPVPNGSQRIVSPGSGIKVVGPHFIPEGNCVRVPTYSLHRDPRYFSPYPESFWPDRWLDFEDRKDIHDVRKPLGSGVQVTLETKAFAPFSSGAATCVGKNLAMQEMRIVASWIVQRFDIQPASGYDLDDWERNLNDYFVMSKGGLPVVLSRRD